MKKALVVIITCFLGLLNFSLVNAEDMKGELNLEIESKELVEGDLVKGKLSVWPIENANLEVFKKYLMQDFMGALKLVEIENLKTSENNADVVELEGLFVVKGTVYTKQMSLFYLDKLFIVSSSDYRIVGLKNKKEEFEILEQSFSSKNNYWIYLSLVVALILTVSLFHKKIWQRINEYKQLEKIKKRSFYHDLFMKSDNREDFEKIYLMKNEWIKLLNEVTPSHDNFFKILNSHQFKKNWERGELEEVKTSFDSIRSSFKK